MKHNGFSHWSLLGMAVLLFLAACAPSTGNRQPRGRTAQEQESEDILARVGERLISVTEFKERFDATSGPAGTLEEQKGKALDRMVLTTLMALEARAEKIDREEAVANALRTITDKALALEYYNRKIRPELTAGDAEIQDYYHRHMDEFTTPAKVKVRHILAGVGPDASAEAWARAEEKARGLKKEIDDGADFAALAREHSDDQWTRAKGGLLRGMTFSYVTKDNLPTGFPEDVFSLEQGEISDPVRGARGYHIIKVEAKQPERIRTLDQAGPEIQRLLETRKYDDVLMQTVQRLKEKYGVVLHTDRLASVKIENRAKRKG
ncbi:MAG: peptidylprolyl isomerase [Desulfobacteraceae bacterium]|jgi:parvulin-like peptidyl-prolyl isomerase